MTGERGTCNKICRREKGHSSGVDVQLDGKGKQVLSLFHGNVTTIGKRQREKSKVK